MRTYTARNACKQNRRSIHAVSITDEVAFAGEVSFAVSIAVDDHAWISIALPIARSSIAVATPTQWRQGIERASYSRVRHGIALASIWSRSSSAGITHGACSDTDDGFDVVSGTEYGRGRDGRVGWLGGRDA